MTIFDIDQAIMACVDAETGEVIDLDKMNALQMERGEKIENVALWVKELDAEAKAIREEEKRLAERRKVNENKIASLKGYLSMALSGQKFSTPRVKISWRKSEAVDIPDPEKIPASWYRAKYEIARDDIKAALKAGEAVPGASLIENTNIQIK